MGNAASSPAPPPRTNVPIRQHQQTTDEDGVAAKLRSLGLAQYTDAFNERGYDDLGVLEELSQDELLEISKSVGMLEGHALKWVRAVSGATVSPAKVIFALQSSSGDAAHNENEATMAKGTMAEEAPSEKDRAIFCFIRAGEIRDCRDKMLPKHQDLRRQRPHWFEDKEITLEGACTQAYVGKILAVSHRWEEQGNPDPKGKQFAALRKYLIAHPKVELVWLDFHCGESCPVVCPDSHFHALTEAHTNANDDPLSFSQRHSRHGLRRKRGCSSALCASSACSSWAPPCSFFVTGRTLRASGRCLRHGCRCR